MGWTIGSARTRGERPGESRATSTSRGARAWSVRHQCNGLLPDEGVVSITDLAAASVSISSSALPSTPSPAAPFHDIFPQMRHAAAYMNTMTFARTTVVARTRILSAAPGRTIAALAIFPFATSRKGCFQSDGGQPRSSSKESKAGEFYPCLETRHQPLQWKRS